jgi:hypothetical protein
MNPLIDPASLAAEERRDPEAFKSEYLAQFVGSGGAFFDPDAIDMAVSSYGELRPQDGVGWVAGLDPAFSSDPFALVLVGRDIRDRRRLLVGLVRSWRPSTRKAVSLDETREIEDTILAEVAQTTRLFNARAVTDQYKAAGVVDRLRRFRDQCAHGADDRADEGCCVRVPTRPAERRVDRALRASTATS